MPCVINGLKYVLTEFLAFFLNFVQGPGLRKLLLGTTLETLLCYWPNGYFMLFRSFWYFSLKLVFMWAMLSSYRLLPTNSTPLKLTFSIFSATLNPGWIENHDVDDAAVWFLFPYPWLARFDHMDTDSFFGLDFLILLVSLTFSLTRSFKTFSLIRL